MKLLLFAVALLALEGAARSSAQTGLTETNARPLDVVAHNPNTLEDAATALEHGANALEPDLMVLPAGPIGAFNWSPPICFAADPPGIVVNHDDVLLTTRIPLTLEQYLDGVHLLAKSPPDLALIS